MEIDKKVAVVTGGIMGIGFVTVQHFLRHGAQYVAIFDIRSATSDITKNALDKLKQEFDESRFGYYVCDVTNIKEFTDSYDDVASSKAYVDILVNNAGICYDRKVNETIDVNLRAVVQCTLHAVDRMGKHKQNKGGVVVNVSSICGLLNYIPIAPIYGSTKQAIVSFVREMKVHNDHLGMRILGICPGMTRTAMVPLDFDVQQLTLDFIPRQMIDEHLSLYLQDPNNVAAAIVELVRRGKGGDVWAVLNDEPPFNTRSIINVEDIKIPFS